MSAVENKLPVVLKKTPTLIEQALADIKADAHIEPTKYLKETIVPEGGE
jgi:hypothetical protein